MRAATSIAIVVAIGIGIAPMVDAQTNQAAATAQFDQGRELMKQKNYADACKAFENSQKLDPQSGTLFNLADCDTHIGKLTTAWLAYRDLSQRDSNAGRKKEASRRAKDLEKRLPRLVLDMPSQPQGLVITINGDTATATVGIPSPVDLGPIKIHAAAPGYTPFDVTKDVATEGKTITVKIALTKVGAVAATKHDDDDDDARSTAPGTTTTGATSSPPTGPIDESPEGSHRKRNGVIGAVVGGALFITGSVFALRARSDWNDAQTICPAHMCGTEADHASGDQLVDSARSNATLATGFMLGGAAIAAIGIYYAVTAKPESQHTALRVTPTTTGAMATLGGSF